MLDVGCGTGGFVRSASDAGWAALGIELSPAAVELCHKHGIQAKLLSIFDSALDAEKFDLIVMSELIEHVPHPTDFLRRANELLSEGGAIYLTTPNWGSLSRRLLEGEWRAIDPEHLSYFTPRTLRSAAGRAELSVQSIRTVNASGAVFRKLFRKPLDPEEGRLADQRLRAKMDVSNSRRVAKRVVNRVLSATGLGETIKAVLTSTPPI